MNFHMTSYLFTQGNDIDHTNKILSLLKIFYGKDCVANMGLGFDMAIDSNAISRYSKAFIDFMVLTTDELILEFDSIKDCKAYYKNQHVNQFINEMKKHHKPIVLLKDILE